VNTKKLLIILLVAVLLVVYYLLGTGYLKQRREYAALSSRVADTTLALAQMAKPPDDLETKLAAAQADLDAARGLLPAKPSSTKLVNTILRLAEACKVKAIPLSTSPWAKGSIGDYSYEIFRINIAVTGGFTDLVNFVDRLENGEISSLTVENINVTRDTMSGAEGTPGKPVSATITLAIYTQPN
jgi:Tfp pilus assembly protein PilO